MPPKFSESTNLQWDRHSDGKWRAHTLRELHRHQAFPVLDGPRGQGWMSGYVQGQYNLNGVFAFAETSGILLYFRQKKKYFLFVCYIFAKKKKIKKI